MAVANHHGYSLERGRRAAGELCELLRDGCERVEVGGSIRRGERHVHDIEIVAIARHHGDLFGGPGEDMLNRLLRQRVKERRLQWRGRMGGAGSEPELAERRLYNLLFNGMPVDLFVVRPPAQWGAILAIRTGPDRYAQRLVTDVQRRGYVCRDGRLVSQETGQDLATPEERDFIQACGAPFLPPHRRA